MTDVPLFTMPPLPHLKLSLFLNIPILLIGLVAFAFFYAVVTSVLVYHWRSYGMNSQGILVAETVYFFVSVVLFVTAGVSLFYY